MARKKSTFWDSARLNNATYQMYYQRLLGVALSMFEWHNLPPSVDARFLEMVLFADGKAVFFKDEVMGELALQVMLGGTLDVYRIPTDRRAFSANGYYRELDEKNSVLIWNNVMHTNSFSEIDDAALRISDIQRTIDTNIKAQKTPVLIMADENERLTMKNLYMQYDGNEPFIFTSKDMKLADNVKVLRTDAPYVADQLFNAKKEIWNEALSALGVPVTDRVKRERLLAAEISGDKAASIAQQFVRLNPRKEACRQINEMFGLDVDVTYRRLDYDAIIEDQQTDGLENDPNHYTDGKESTERG